MYYLYFYQFIFDFDLYLYLDPVTIVTIKKSKKKNEKDSIIIFPFFAFPLLLAILTLFFLSPQRTIHYYSDATTELFSDFSKISTFNIICVN